MLYERAEVRDAQERRQAPDLVERVPLQARRRQLLKGRRGVDQAAEMPRHRLRPVPRDAGECLPALRQREAVEAAVLESHPVLFVKLHLPLRLAQFRRRKLAQVQLVTQATEAGHRKARPEGRAPERLRMR